MLGLQNEREWGAFCATVLQRPELAADERFSANFKRSAAREALRQIIVEAFAALTAAQVVERLEQANIANAQVNDMHDVWAHPQLAARGRWRDIETPAGTVPALLPPGTNDEQPARMDAVPALGAHTDKILGSFGYSAERIAELRTQGAI
jgi:itaconate CoA-transferase